MKWRKTNLFSFSHSLFFLLVLIVLATFWFPKSAEAVCANTTTFDPNTKTTLFNMGGVDLGRAVNIPPWISPAPFDGATWSSRDVCTPVTAISTVTILPTSYSFQSNNATKQSYLTRGTYDWSEGNPRPPQPICKPGNACSGYSGLDEATCNGHDCNYNNSWAYWTADLNPWPYNVYIPEQLTNGYGLRITGPSPWSVLKERTLDLMTAEDSVIDGIASHGTIDLKVDTPSLGDSYTYHIPATNCVKLSGNGPRKVVFMRGKTWNSSVSDFLTQVNNVIDIGFKAIDPFKTYQDQFSFYVDLHKVDDSDFPRESLSKGVTFTSGTGDIVKVQSSCFDVSDDNTQYFFLHEATGIHDAFSLVGKSVSFEKPSVVDILEYIHEFGHTFGNLFDEYIYAHDPAPFGSFSNFLYSFGAVNIAKNCTLSPRQDYRGTDNHIYGSVTARGCSFIYDTRPMPKLDPRPYYRPSRIGLMNTDYTGPNARFNVVDCGYIMAAINGEIPNKKNARKYWPKPCLDMARATPSTVISDEIPSSVSPTPTSIVPVSDKVSPGFSVSLSGSNFTSTDNVAQFTNTATSAFYETLGIPSNGTTLSFLVPSDTPPGNYTLKVGAFNSDWSNSVPFTITAVRTPVLSLTATPSSVPLGEPTTLTWLTQGASTCTGNSTMDKPPELWSNPDIAGSLILSLADPATFSLTCTGPGGTVSKNVAVAVTSPLPPAVSLTATASSVSAGSGVTIAWSTSGANSCQGSGTGDGATLLAWNKSQPVTGFLYLTPTVNTSLTLSCSGLGGTSSKTFPITIPPITPLSVSCSVIPTPTVRKNELTTYTANATGGNGAYTYSWTGTDGLVGSAPQASRFYTSTGAKTASVTVSSAGQSKTAQCPSVQYNSSINSPAALVISGNSHTASLSPASGPSGTTVTIVGQGSAKFADGASTVVIKKLAWWSDPNPTTIYVRPISVQSSFLNFTFIPSLPLPPPSNGTTYNVSVINNYLAIGLFEGSAQTFTLSATPQPPVITTATPSSGPVNTSITLAGSNFTRDTRVIITRVVTRNAFTGIVVPTFVSASSLRFTFSPTLIEIGSYIIKVSNQGVTSNVVTFSNTTPTPVNPPVEKLMPPVLKLKTSLLQKFVASVLNGLNLLFGR